MISSVLVITCLFPQGLAVSSNPSNPESLYTSVPYRGHWQVGDTSAYYKASRSGVKPYLLSYNSSDSVNNTIISKNSDYSSPILNATGIRNEWMASWIGDTTSDTYINLTRSPSPSYNAFDLTLKSPSSAELKLAGNLDIQTAHLQFNVEGFIFDASSYIGLAYKVTFTAGHYYTVKLGNKDWEPINTSATYPSVRLLIFPAPSVDGVIFYDPDSGYYPNIITGSLQGFINVIPYFIAATGIHPLSTQDYYVVALPTSSSNKWIPQELLIQDEENVWEDYLAANPWYYFFPQVNPWLFLLVIGGIAAVIVFVVTRIFKKSKLKAPASSGAKGEFLDEL